MTLLETLVVVALTALLSALAYPDLQRSARLLRYQEARVRLVADASEVRARAITTGRPTALRASDDGTAYAGIDGRIVRLPGGLRLIAPAGAPRFLADGSAEGGPILLESPAWRALIGFDSATGLVASAAP